MKTIWAPWRMAYIGASKQKEGCIFCQARDAADGRDHLVLTRTEHSLVMLNRFPYTPGHLMVTPLRHNAELDDLNDDELLDLMHCVRLTQTILRQAARPDGFNIGLNLGRSAGAGIEDHLHVHVVPRWQGDTNFMPVIAGVRVLPEELQETYERFSLILGEGV